MAPLNNRAASALRVAKKYGPGGTVSDEDAPPPAGLMDYGTPAVERKAPLPEEATAYPEWTMGNAAPAGEAPKVGPVPYEIAPKAEEKRGIMERAKAGFGDEDIGFSQEHRRWAPWPLQPLAAIADVGMRLPGAAAGAAAGVAEHMGMSRSGADSLQRDLGKLADYPGAVPGAHAVLPGAGAFAKMKAAEAIKGVKDAELIPQNAAGSFMSKLKQPSAPLPAYDIPPEDVAKFTKIGGQAGSNPGGLYRDPSSGAEYYVKTPKTADHARNEMLAAKLYQLADVPVADIKLSQHGGKDAIVSPIVEGKVLNKYWESEYDQIKGLRENFPVDVWLGNYDAVGTGKDNVIIDKNGTAHRIDMGGALRYRAQGKLKDKFTGDISKDMAGMQDPNVNWDAAEIFGGAKADEFKPAAQRVANITDDQIREMVSKYGPLHQSQKAVDNLANTLMERRDAVAEAFGVKKGGEVPPDPSGGVVSGLPHEHNMPDDLPPLSPESYKQGAQMLMEKTRGNTFDMAMGLYTIAKKYGPEVADNFADHLPKDIRPEVGAHLDDIAKTIGHDPWVKDRVAPPDIDQYFDLNDPEKVRDMDPFLKDQLEYEAAVAHQQAKEKAIAEGAPAQNLADAMKHYKEAIERNFTPIPQDKIADYIPRGDMNKFHPVTITEEQKKALGPYIKNMLPFWVFKGGEVASEDKMGRPIQKKGINHDHYNLQTGKIEYHIPDMVEKEAYPYKEIMQPGEKFQEKGFFAGVEPNTAHGYSYWAQPYIGFAFNPVHIDWFDTFGKHNAVWRPDYMNHLIEKAREAGHDVLFVTNIEDSYHKPGHPFSDERKHTQIIFLNTEGRLKSPFAEMKDFKSRLIHAGLAGMGVVGGGLLINPDQSEAADIPKKASGGAVGYTHPIRMKKGGLLNAPIPGRTDKIPVNVPSGSYVLPADIPSALGQGNTMAGAQILNNMFNTGPFGLKPMKPGRAAQPPRWMQGPKPLMRRAEGGEAEGDEERLPIIAAGGEYIIDPEVVRAIGGGNMTAGHKALDKFVLQVRKEHIKTLKGLKPPKR